MSSAILSIGLVIGTVVVLIALFFKKDEAPTNYILLFAFVSVDWYMCMHGQNRLMVYDESDQVSVCLHKK